MWLKCRVGRSVGVQGEGKLGRAWELDVMWSAVGARKITAVTGTEDG